MKRFNTILTALLITASAFIPQHASAQAPQKMSYQAVVRDANSELIKSSSIGMRISIIQSAVDGAEVYAETHNPVTNENGLVTVEIGNGTVETGDFSTIDWTNGPYFIKTETDPLGGADYSTTGTSQLLSVPYALHASTADRVTGAINENQNLGDVLSLGNDGGAKQIKNIADPSGEKDAVTKSYVTLRVSETGDTLFMGSKQRVIIPGISASNPNTPPDVPEVYFPNDGTLDLPLDMFLKWNCNDANGDKLMYDLYFDKADGSTLIKTDIETQYYEVVGLSPNTIYYWKVVVSDGNITTESPVWSFTTKDGSENITVKDIDGNIYRTVTLGNQTWMAENLRVTRYADATSIPKIEDGTEWANLNDDNIDKAYCWYDNDSITYSQTYGALYTHAAAINGEDSDNRVQGICPTGWHLPSSIEWEELENYLADNGYNYDGTIGGGAAKIGKALADSTGWNTYTDVGAVGNDLSLNNSSGFTALPSGYRRGKWDGSFSGSGIHSFWWTSKDLFGGYCYDRYLVGNSESLKISPYDEIKSRGYGVRCVKDY